MGQPKALLEYKGLTFYEYVYRALRPCVLNIVGLGRGPYPNPGPSVILEDPPGIAGPIAGLLAANHWDPECAWVVCAVDMPRIREEAVRWLLAQRAPGMWAVVPRLRDRQGVEPLLAHYEPMIFPYLQKLAGNPHYSLQALARHPRVKTPTVPDELTDMFTNINTPEEATQLTLESPDVPE